MNGIDEFLQTKVKTYQEEINKIDDVLAKVAPTFGYQHVSWCRGNNCKQSSICRERFRKSVFPYKIVAPGDKESAIVSGWSTSTNAMMLNMVAFLKDPEFKSSLIRGSRTLVIPEKVHKKIEKEGSNQI